MRWLQRAVACLLAFACAALGGASAGQKVELKMKLRPGRYAVSETQDMTGRQSITVMGRTQSIDIKSSAQVDGTIEIQPPDAASGETKVLYKCTRVKMSLVQGGRAMAFDSAGPEDQQDRTLGPVLRPLVGWRGFQVHSRDGKFLRLEGLEELIAQVSGAGGGTQSVAMIRRMVEPLLKEILTRHWGKLLPEKPVAPADEWRKRIELAEFPMFGKLGFDFTCLLKRLEQTPTGPVAMLECWGKASVQDRKLDLKAMGLPMKVDAKADTLTVQTELRVRFDTHIGLATGLTATTRVKATLAIGAPDGSKAAIDMKQTVKSTYSLQPRPAAAAPLTGAPQT